MRKRPLPRAIYPTKGRALEYDPWACNLYRGCGHGCVYCYAPAVLHCPREAFHAEITPRTGILDALERQAPKHAKEHPGEPVLLCFTSDPYGPCPVGTQTTRTAIDILTYFKIPVHVLTKGGTKAERDFDLLSRVRGSAYAATITNMDAMESRSWEPNAADPADRLAAMIAAKARGLQTWLSLEPVVNPAQALAVIRKCAPHADEIRVGRLNYHPRAKEIDWPRFRSDATTLLQSLGCRHYIKEDLRNA